MGDQKGDQKNYVVVVDLFTAKAPEVLLRGFLSRFTVENPSGWSSLAISVQPFAYVVTYYSCHNGDQECGGN